MATIDVQDAAGVTRTIDILGTVPDNGRAAAAASRPVALSTEDKTSLDAVTTKVEELRALVAGTDPQLPAALVGGRLSVTNPDSLPLPTGAATSAGVAEVRDRLPSALVGGRLSVGNRVLSYDYPISTANSSTTQLAAGASFTGTIESAQDQPSLSILMTCDQPTTVTVRQFIDAGGTFAVPDVVIYVPANAGLARSLPINGNFVRVIVRNDGAATTTTFNLNCAFGLLGDADSSGAQPVTEPPLVITGAAAQTATVNNILTPVSGTAALNVASFRTASVQVSSTGTGGTFIFEQSNDGTNWVALPVFNAALVTGVPITAAITATASQIVYSFPVRCNFLRLRIATTITGGSIQAFTRLSSDPWSPAAMLVASNTAANLQATVSGTVGVTGYPTAAASADALANPTVTKIDATGLLFNGTTWDRARNNHNAAVEASSAKTATGNGATQTNFNAAGALVWINVSAVTGTTPTLTVRLQWSPDGGTTWVDLDTTNAQTASITATGTFVLRVYPGITTAANAALNSPLPRTWRLAWTIGGTTPSFTFSAQAAYVN